MVSGTRCPAWSDQLKQWSGSRAAAPKGRCPVGHRGEFPYVLRGHIWGLWGNFPWYSMGVLHLFQFIISFPYYSMVILHFSYFLVNFPYYSMGNLHFANFPCYSMGIWGLIALGGYGRTDGHMEIHPCVLQDISPLGPLPKKSVRDFNLVFFFSFKFYDLSFVAEGQGLCWK